MLQEYRNRRRLPLHWRLPLALSMVLLIALAAVSWFAYSEVSRNLRATTIERLHSVAGQLAERLSTSGGRETARSAQIAANPVLQQFLRAEGAADDAQRLLNALATRSSARRTVELRDAQGRRVLAAGADTLATTGLGLDAIERVTFNRSAAVGGFVQLGERVAWPTVAAIKADTALLGYLLEWSYFAGTAARRQATAELIGEGSDILLGSPLGVWTDQVQSVPPPPIDVSAASGAIDYQRQGLGRRIAVVAAARGTPWLVLVEFSEAQTLAPATRFLRRVAVTALLCFLIALSITVLVVRRITLPLRTVTKAAESLSDGDYSRRVRLTGNDEIALLGATFDTMAERIEDTHMRLQENNRELRATQEQFFHAQRMEATGRLAGGIAHDFNNLLTVILGETELTKTADMSTAARESLAEIERAGERAAALTRQLLAFSRRQVLEPTVFDMNDLLGGVERMLTRVIGAHVRLGIRRAPQRAAVRADRGQIEQVIVNLAVNARDAMPSGGELKIEIDKTTLDAEYAATRPDVTPGQYVVIAVSDTGTGMDADTLAHVFEPFFTTKPSGKGTGLGLAAAYGIARQLGGHIAAYSEPGVGTTMRVYLPAVEANDDTPVARVRNVRGGNETILLVEDEVTVRDVALRMLNRHGYQVLAAGDADEAIDLVRTYEGPIHLLLTDVVLPGRGGRELADAITALRPDTRVLFMSGYTADVIFEHRLVGEDTPLLQKPYTAESLALKLRELLDN